MEDFCSRKDFRLIETSPDPDLNFSFQNYFFDVGYKVTKNTLDNAFWYLEGEYSNLILFHFFSNHDNKEVKFVVCNMGSDIFDCLKLNTDLISKGGYLVEDENKRRIINPVLNVFKKDVADIILKLYQDARFNHYRLDITKITDAIDLEFQAEANYQKVIDAIFDKLGITTTMKFFIDQFRDVSKDIRKGKFQENNYLPSSPNFDPLINDSFVKFLGLDAKVSIENYYSITKEEITYYHIKEKELNWVYAENASICGIWNALADTADGLVMLLPRLYEILTDRAMLKRFFYVITNLIHSLPRLKEMLTLYDIENSSGSIYKFNYQQCYEIMLITTLLLPIPKTGKGSSAVDALKDFANYLGKFSEKGEIVLLMYRLGLKVEKTADEWTILSQNVKIFTGTKERVMQRMEHIAEVAVKNPKFIMRNLSLGKLDKLVDVKKGLGSFLKGFSKEDRLLVQSKLYNSNIAFAKFKVSFKGRTIVVDMKAYAGSNISKLDKFDFCKSPNLRIGEKIEDFIDITVNNPKGQGRFKDTESKIFREFEDVRLKEVMNQLGAKSASDLTIEVELQTILDPCMKCQEQMVKFQAKYNAEINIYSTGAKETKVLNDLYPKFEVINPKK